MGPVLGRITARHSEACQVDIWTLGPPGQVQDHQDHHQDDQEQLLDNFKEGFKRFKGGLRSLIRFFFNGFNVPFKGQTPLESTEPLNKQI